MNNLKPSELRIGNWVNNNEEDYQITSATITINNLADAIKQLKLK